jgi:hypothetical protein
MDVGHFGFILDGKQQSKLASSERLELLANTAAKRYLEEGTDLNDSIRKVASENDLNSHQIERVCEMANIATHQGLWRKTAQKSNIEFPLAKAAMVIKTIKPTSEPGQSSAEGGCGCGNSPCGCNIKPMSSDYAGPPTGLPLKGPSTMSMMGADPAQVHNGLSQEPERKQIIIVLQKKAHARKMLEDKLLYEGMMLETLQKRAFETVKQTVLGGATFRQVYEAAAGSGLGKIAEETLPEFEEKLIEDTHGSTRQRLVKMAIGKAPEDMVSNELGNMTVINGAHPVLVSLDTLNRKTGEIRNGLHNLLRIDDEVKTYTQRLRELT